ncbi:MAG TPA: hypothetical protein VJ963_09735 [Bacteroidales bacterium]|nr:hypothetical protein [Bacteroidales bacterium]
MKKLSYMGIGPKIGMTVLPLLAMAILTTVSYRSMFTYFVNSSRILFFTGLAFVIAGSLIYFFTIPSLLNGLKNTQLITSGTYYLCCNPLYSSVIMFIVPGVSLMMNSWLILAVSPVGYVFLKIYIKDEYEEMEGFFGDEFRKYRSETPGFFPFPFKKIFKRV